MKKLIIYSIVLILLVLTIYSYETNNSQYYVNFEFGAGHLDEGNSTLNHTALIGGQLLTFNHTINLSGQNVSVEEGLLKQLFYVLGIAVPGGKLPSSKRSFIAKKFEFSVDTDKAIYYYTEPIQASIEFINNEKALKNVRFTYYLFNDGIIYSVSDLAYDTVNKGTYQFNVNATLPAIDKKDDWFFCVDYESNIHPKISVCEAFAVTDSKIRIFFRKLGTGAKWAIIITIAGLLLLAGWNWMGKDENLYWQQ